MGIFTSLLMPLLKTGAVIGASAIPGAGPVLAPIVAGAMTAGQSALGGQGPLTSLAQGAISSGMQVGMGQLGDMMNGAEGVADTSQLGQQATFASPGMAQAAGMQNDALTQWSMRDLQSKLAQRNGFMINKGGLGF